MVSAVQLACKVICSPKQHALHSCRHKIESISERHEVQVKLSANGKFSKNSCCCVYSGAIKKSALSEFSQFLLKEMDKKKILGSIPGWVEARLGGAGLLYLCLCVCSLQSYSRRPEACTLVV